MTREEAVAIIRKSELADHADRIIDDLRPSVLLDAARVPVEELPIGASRIGGVPDVPEDSSWPRWTGSRLEFAGFGAKRRTAFPEKHLEFIAQLNLEDLHGFPACEKLPPVGALYFFFDIQNQPWGYDPEDHRGARVIYLNQHANTLKRTQNPSPVSSLESFPCKLSCSQNWTISNPKWLPSSIAEDLETLERIDELKQELLGSSEDRHYQPIHRLFGWPEPVQGDMQLECQLVANGVYCGGSEDDPRVKDLASGADDWRLLLQIDTDEENPGWMWGDCGRIYYWIHKEDLAYRRFEKVRLILQCS